MRRGQNRWALLDLNVFITLFTLCYYLQTLGHLGPPGGICWFLFMEAHLCM